VRVRPGRRGPRQNGPVAKRVEHRGDGDGGAKIERRRQVALIGVAVAAILLVWFALGNFHDVGIRFWIYQRRAPLIIVILISGLLGALITALIMRRRPKTKE
jgi:uncharacterized integral membrane protein